jgi:putative ABC transport system permease protein
MILNQIILAFKTIRANKTEVGLTILGIVVGIASVTLILALGEGISEMLRQKMATYKPNVVNIIYSPGKKTSSTAPSAFKSFGGGGGGEDMMANLFKMISQAAAKTRRESDTAALPYNIEQAKAQIQTSPYVADIDFFVRVSKPLDWYGKNITGYVSYTENTFQEYLKEKMVAGRVYSEAEVANNVPVALVKMSRAKYQALLTYGGPLGQQVMINNQLFRIIGVLEGADDIELYIPYTFYADFATIDDAPQFLVRFYPGAGNQEVSTSFFNWVKQFVFNGDYYQQNSDLGLFNQLLVYIPKFTLLMSSVAGISLVVGGIGIMNSMISSVMRRTREIGIQKSIGEKKMSIVSTFMVETLLITSIGGSLGIVLGVLLSTGVLNLFDIPPVFPVLAIIYSLIFTIAIGFASGITPAIQAAELDPIKALGHS